MRQSTNPFEPKRVPDSQHVQDIVHEALQEWIQKYKIPYTVQTERGPVELNMEDMFVIQGLMRKLINDHKWFIDESLITGVDNE